MLHRARGTISDQSEGALPGSHQVRGSSHRARYLPMGVRGRTFYYFLGVMLFVIVVCFLCYIVVLLCVCSVLFACVLQRV